MKKITIDEGFLRTLINKESNKIVGKCLKRFDISVENKEVLNISDINNLKSQIKNVLHESLRDVIDIIIYAQCTDKAIFLEK